MKKSIILFVPLFLLVLSSCETYEEESAYRHLTYLPEAYESNPDSSFSLLIYLHGAGGRGEDLELLKGIAIPKQLEEGRQIPAIVIAPQAPLSEEHFYPLRLQLTLEFVQSEYNIDPKRIYLTGLSMGGHSTWLWASEHPGNFAALAPLCGFGKTKWASSIAHIPTWVFHGNLDETVSVEESQNMVDALKEEGGDPKFTIYEDLGHSIWDTTYADQAFYDWLFAQSQ
jgi:predicted peptidase